MRALAAVDVLGPKPGEDWSETVKKIAAALDEARAEGRKEALGDAVPLKDLMAEALDGCKPNPNPGKTHYQGDDCPGGHASVCGYCGAPCPTCRNAPGEGEPVLRLPRAPRAPA